MHSIDELHWFGLEPRVTAPLKRTGYNYVEDLLGTSPRHVTIAEGPPPRLWHEPGVPIKVNAKAWDKYRYRDPWLSLPRISNVAVQNILQALGKWKASNRENLLRNR
jgi:hypothetical protein